MRTGQQKHFYTYYLPAMLFRHSHLRKYEVPAKGLFLKSDVKALFASGVTYCFFLAWIGRNGPFFSLELWPARAQFALADQTVGLFDRSK
jgi:hypothetical protein